MLVDDAMQVGGNIGERFVPGDLLEFAAALGPDSSQWVEEALWAVHPIEESVDLGAQLAS